MQQKEKQEESMEKLRKAIEDMLDDIQQDKDGYTYITRIADIIEYYFRKVH